MSVLLQEEHRGRLTIWRLNLWSDSKSPPATYRDAEDVQVKTHARENLHHWSIDESIFTIITKHVITLYHPITKCLQILTKITWTDRPLDM